MIEQLVIVYCIEVCLNLSQTYTICAEKVIDKQINEKILTHIKRQPGIRYRQLLQIPGLL
jgi:hypothetical protein